MTIARELARYIVQTRFCDLPADVVEHTKMCILDLIGAALPGVRDQLVQILREVVGRPGNECTIIGDGTKTSCLEAALINGTIAYVLKLDQSSPRGSMVHPQPQMIPAAIAVGEKEGLGGRDLITSVFLGFEIAGRVALAVNPSHEGERGFHGTGTCGTFGAATAAGKLLQLNEDQMVNALALGGTQAAGFTASLESFARSLHSGKAAYNGILAAMLARKGFSGVETIFEARDGFCGATTNRYDLAPLTASLGQSYLIRDQRFVRFVTCGAMHAAIDAVIDLTKKNTLRPDVIEAIEARTFPVTIDMCYRAPEPKTFAEAQFNLPFALAVAAIDGDVGIGQLTAERLKSPQVLVLAKRVRGMVDPEFAARGISGSGDMFQSAKVFIKTKDGREYHQEVNVHKGSPQNPFTREELLQKFRSLATMILPETKVAKIIEMVKELEELDSVRKLTKLLYP
jgi:2-methylcitrate dehydratase PrpD